MSLTGEISDAIVAIGTETKSIRNAMGNTVSLATTDKDSLVDAINEIFGLVGGGGPVTAADITDATTVGRAVLTAADAAAARTAIAAGTSNLAIGTTGTTAKAGNYAPAAADISDSTTTGRALVTAINAAAARTTLAAYSSAETDSAIAAAVAALVNSSPAALDTLKELSDALGGDASFAATTATALGNRLRVDTASQGLNGTQQANGRTNLDVYSKAEIGDPTTDFAAIFAAAIA